MPLKGEEKICRPPWWFLVDIVVLNPPPTCFCKVVPGLLEMLLKSGALFKDTPRLLSSGPTRRNTPHSIHLATPALKVEFLLLWSDALKTRGEDASSIMHQECLSPCHLWWGYWSSKKKSRTGILSNLSNFDYFLRSSLCRGHRKGKDDKNTTHTHTRMLPTPLAPVFPYETSVSTRIPRRDARSTHPVAKQSRSRGATKIISYASFLILYVRCWCIRDGQTERVWERLLWRVWTIRIKPLLRSRTRHTQQN